jgi:DNA-binding response OmpR family regulator
MTVLDAAVFTHILLVVDNPAQGLEAALVARGYRITRAETEDLAVEMAAHDEPDAVIIDLRTPRRRIEALTRRLRSVNEAMPVLILLARGRRAAWGEADARTRRLSKPSDVLEVISVLEILLFGGERPNEISR